MRNTFRLGIVLLLFLIIVPSALSIGITPGRKTVDYLPRKQVNVEVSVLNSDHKEFYAVVYAEGPLEDEIELSTKELRFKASDLEKRFSYKVTLPSWLLEEPGAHDTMIVVKELTPEGKPGEIKTKVEVAHQLRVNVVYPGTLAKAELIVQPGKPILFIVPVFSVGEEDIKQAEASIDVFDMKGNRIANVKTNAKSVESGMRRDLTAELDIDEPGLYYAIATVNYDGKTVTAAKVFTYGEFFLNLAEITVNNFRLGNIAKFNILVENLANSEVKDAQAEMILKDKTGAQIADIKSMAEDIGAQESKTLEAFWDTAGIQADIYKGKIILTHDDNMSQEQVISMKVSENEIITSIGDITGFVVDEEIEGPGDSSTVILLLIMLLVVANISWVIYVKRIKK